MDCQSDIMNLFCLTNMLCREIIRVEFMKYFVHMLILLCFVYGKDMNYEQFINLVQLFIRSDRLIVHDHLFLQSKHFIIQNTILKQKKIIYYD